ncbi:MAG: class I tRNA ligase family protein, partial [Patescibacteria group bacterium]
MAIDQKLPEKLLRPYDSKATEERIYKLWENSGFFQPEAGAPWTHARETNPNFNKSFTIIMPPVNANGSLHAGHGLVMTIEDIMIRYKRMRGYKTLWLPGLDHAGFETQVVYEKKLEKEGRTRFEIAPKKLYQEIMDFTLANSKNIKSQIRKMGASCDWSREKFTLDPDIVKTVYQTFKKLSDDGLVYRGNRIVSWCSKHQTSFSDLEITDEERVENFYYLKYGPFTIGTSRPETKFGDKYVVMHPKDKRYIEYKHGQKIKLEWINGPITATIIKDEAVDMTFGTGVMTITPWHDTADFEIAERHKLDKEQIIDENGKLLPIAGEFAGQHIKKARALIVEKLKSKGLVEKVDENYKHVVRTCYKCATVIEPQIKSQWFVKMKPLAEKALEKIKNGEIVYIPE